MFPQSEVLARASNILSNMLRSGEMSASGKPGDASASVGTVTQALSQAVYVRNLVKAIQLKQTLKGG